MASKKTSLVVSYTVVPNAPPVKAKVDGPMTPGKARNLADKLNDAAALADMDPNLLTTYMVESA